ncbi:hypothetical protein FF1_022576 [Malus domestica]
METASKMVEKATAFTSGKSSTEAKEKVEALNKDIEAGQGSSNVNSEEGQGSGIGIQNEYRICQDEDYLHKLKAPCRCNGTLKESPGGRAHSSPGRMASVEGICRTSAFFSGSLGQAFVGQILVGQDTLRARFVGQFLSAKAELLTKSIFVALSEV